MATPMPGRGSTCWLQLRKASFDPTNGIVGNAGSPVVSAVDPCLAVPLHGAWRGMRSDFLGMDVEVDIGASEAAAEQPRPRLRVAGAG